MQLNRHRARRAAAVALAGLTLVTCGGGSKATPQQPTAPIDPGPTPVAPLAPQPLSASCDRLPLGSERYQCRDESGSFMVELHDSINELKQQHPEYFASGDIITNVGGYVVGVIRNLDKKGICAAFDGEELTVKNSPDFSDQIKIFTSWNQVREFYIGTCYPALFPLARATYSPSPAGCNLPPSREAACGDPGETFRSDVESAIDQVVATKPELFDSSQKSGDWVSVKDMNAYEAAVIQVLAQKGYCGIFDGEEIQIKRSNDFSEHYDINYRDQYIRKGPGIYRGTCYPAAF